MKKTVKDQSFYVNLQCIKVYYASQLNRYPAFEVVSWKVPVKRNFFNESSPNLNLTWTQAPKDLQISQALQILETQRNWSVKIVSMHIAFKKKNGINI